MIIEYAEIQKYNLDLHFKSIKESINNQIIEMKNKKVAQQFSKWAIFLAMTAGGKIDIWVFLLMKLINSYLIL